MKSILFILFAILMLNVAVFSNVFSSEPTRVEKSEAISYETSRQRLGLGYEVTLDNFQNQYSTGVDAEGKLVQLAKIGDTKWLNK